MLKHVLGMLLVAALTGCVSTKNVRIDQSNAEVMRGKSMALTTSDKPDFAAMTAGKAMFALIGAFAMISKGNEIIKTYDVPDPAVYIGKKVAEKISAANSVSKL